MSFKICGARFSIYDVEMAKALFSIARHYQTLDRYPDKYQAVVEQIKGLIDRKVYAYFTEVENIPENTFTNVFSYDVVSVVRFPNIPKWVIKGTRLGLKGENIKFRIRHSYGSSNREGGIIYTFFRLVERVAFANEMRAIIKRHHLTMLKVPRKFLLSYPSGLVPSLSLPLHNKRVFVISKYCPIDENLIMPLNEQEQIELARQLNILFNNLNGILDLTSGNFGFKGKRLVFIDTEKFSLDPLSRFCVSNQLRGASTSLHLNL